MELRIKNTEDELMMAHGGLLMKWIDPDVMTGHNKRQKRTTVRNIRRLCTIGALWRTYSTLRSCNNLVHALLLMHTNTHDVRPTYI